MSKLVKYDKAKEEKIKHFLRNIKQSDVDAATEAVTNGNMKPEHKNFIIQTINSVLKKVQQVKDSG